MRSSSTKGLGGRKRNSVFSNQASTNSSSVAQRHGHATANSDSLVQREHSVTLNNSSRSNDHASRFHYDRVSMQGASVQTPSVGARVAIRYDGGSHEGTLRYLGKLQVVGREGIWAGVELDGPHGKNDGSVGEHRFFKCAPRHGIFCRLSALTELPSDTLQSDARQTKTPSPTGSLSKRDEIHMILSPPASPRMQTTRELASTIGIMRNKLRSALAKNSFIDRRSLEKRLKKYDHHDTSSLDIASFIDMVRIDLRISQKEISKADLQDLIKHLDADGREILVDDLISFIMDPIVSEERDQSPTPKSPKSLQGFGSQEASPKRQAEQNGQASSSDDEFLQYGQVSPLLSVTPEKTSPVSPGHDWENITAILDGKLLARTHGTQNRLSSDVVRDALNDCRALATKLCASGSSAEKVGQACFESSVFRLAPHIVDLSNEASEQSIALRACQHELEAMGKTRNDTASDKERQLMNQLKQLRGELHENHHEVEVMARANSNHGSERERQLMSQLRHLRGEMSAVQLEVRLAEESQSETAVVLPDELQALETVTRELREARSVERRAAVEFENMVAEVQTSRQQTLQANSAAKTIAAEAHAWKELEASEFRQVKGQLVSEVRTYHTELERSRETAAASYTIQDKNVSLDELQAFAAVRRELQESRSVERRASLEFEDMVAEVQNSRQQAAQANSAAKAIAVEVHAWKEFEAEEFKQVKSELLAKLGTTTAEMEMARQKALAEMAEASRAVVDKETILNAEVALKRRAIAEIDEVRLEGVGQKTAAKAEIMCNVAQEIQSWKDLEASEATMRRNLLGELHGFRTEMEISQDVVSREIAVAHEATQHRKAVLSAESALRRQSAEEVDAIRVELSKQKHATKAELECTIAKEGAIRRQLEISEANAAREFELELGELRSELGASWGSASREAAAASQATKDREAAWSEEASIWQQSFEEANFARELAVELEHVRLSSASATAQQQQIWEASERQQCLQEKIISLKARIGDFQVLESQNAQRGIEITELEERTKIVDQHQTELSAQVRSTSLQEQKCEARLQMCKAELAAKGSEILELKEWARIGARDNELEACVQQLDASMRVSAWSPQTASKMSTGRGDGRQDLQGKLFAMQQQTDLQELQDMRAWKVAEEHANEMHAARRSEIQMSEIIKQQRAEIKEMSQSRSLHTADRSRKQLTTMENAKAVAALSPHDSSQGHGEDRRNSPISAVNKQISDNPLQPRAYVSSRSPQRSPTRPLHSPADHLSNRFKFQPQLDSVSSSYAAYPSPSIVSPHYSPSSPQRRQPHSCYEPNIASWRRIEAEHDHGECITHSERPTDMLMPSSKPPRHSPSPTPRALVLPASSTMQSPSSPISDDEKKRQLSQCLAANMQSPSSPISDNEKRWLVTQYPPEQPKNRTLGSSLDSLDLNKQDVDKTMIDGRQRFGLNIGILDPGPEQCNRGLETMVPEDWDCSLSLRETLQRAALSVQTLANQAELELKRTKIALQSPTASKEPRSPATTSTTISSVFHGNQSAETLKTFADAGSTVGALQQWIGSSLK